jgi:hypothetical protein
MKSKILLILFVFFLLMVSSIPFPSTGIFHNSDEYYFKNVNVLIIGRCRTIGSDGAWIKELFIGNQQYSEVYVTDTRFEGIRVIIFNESIFNPWISFSGLINTKVFMHDAKGIFFWACWKQYSAGPIPPIVFVLCHAQEVWVRCA